jgi:CheY-like chemotaxis protein
MQPQPARLVGHRWTPPVHLCFVPTLPLSACADSGQRPETRPGQAAPIRLLPPRLEASISPLRERSSEDPSDILPYHQQYESPPAPLRHPALLPRPLVLVIEDDASIAELLRELLELEEYAVETEAMGRAGLLRLAAGNVDLLILDLKLPDIGGLALCQQLRSWEREHTIRSRTPIVVLTAISTSEIQGSCRQAGADEYVSKPFEIDALLEAVQRQIGAASAVRGTM